MGCLLECDISPPARGRIRLAGCKRNRVACCTLGNQGTGISGGCANGYFPTAVKLDHRSRLHGQGSNPVGPVRTLDGTLTGDNVRPADGRPGGVQRGGAGHRGVGIEMGGKHKVQNMGSNLDL